MWYLLPAHQSKRSATTQPRVFTSTSRAPVSPCPARRASGLPAWQRLSSDGPAFAAREKGVQRSEVGASADLRLHVALELGGVV
jgi:hypothetical protein